MSHNIGFKNILQAFLAGTNKSLKNDEACSGNNAQNLLVRYLQYHGNVIAYFDVKDPGTVWISLAGYPTVTTRARLNIIINELTDGTKNGIYQKKHVQYAYGPGFDEEIEASDWLVIKEGALAL